MPVVISVFTLYSGWVSDSLVIAVRERFYLSQWLFDRSANIQISPNVVLQLLSIVVISFKSADGFQSFLLPQLLALETEPGGAQQHRAQTLSLS